MRVTAFVRIDFDDHTASVINTGSNRGMTGNKKPQVTTQQELLRAAMAELGMTRAEFAARICVPVRTLDKWLLTADSLDARAMSEMGKAYVRDILEWHRKET